MSELSLMRAAIIRMEQRETTAVASTPGASGSGSGSTGPDAMHAHSLAPPTRSLVPRGRPPAPRTRVSSPRADSSAGDAPLIAPLPEKKALITTSMIRKYMGIPEDPKDSEEKKNDRRWYDIRVGRICLRLSTIFLTLSSPSYATF